VSATILEPFDDIDAGDSFAVVGSELTCLLEKSSRCVQLVLFERHLGAVDQLHVLHASIAHSCTPVRDRHASVAGYSLAPRIDR
jgi:hypothetical protein